jgi:hypothetical protein
MSDMIGKNILQYQIVGNSVAAAWMWPALQFHIED